MIQPGCVGVCNNLISSENWKHQKDPKPHPPLSTWCSITQADSQVRKDNGHLQAFGILSGQTEHGQLKWKPTTKTDEFKCKKWHKCQQKCPNNKMGETALKGMKLFKKHSTKQYFLKRKKGGFKRCLMQRYRSCCCL